MFLLIDSIDYKQLIFLKNIVGEPPTILHDSICVFKIILNLKIPYY